jgi:hypothetical protein
MSTNITTKHPSGQQGLVMNPDDYDVVRETVLTIMETHQTLNMPELTRLAYNELNGKIKGDAVAATKAVQNDLEAKGLLERKYRAGQHQVIFSKQPASES